MFQILRQPAILVCLGLAASSTPARGDDVTAVPPVVVTASRLPATQQATTASVTVISRADIEARSPASVIDLLRQVPGMHIDQPGGRGGISSVYLRGGDPNYTLVLIDGVAVNDPTNNRGGSFDFSMLDPNHIERIEIVRGPLSAVYGSDALGGVINIITRQAEPVHTRSLTAGTGEEGWRRAAAGARGPLGTGEYAVTAAFDDAGSPVEGSSYLGRSLSATAGVPVTGDSWLKLATYYANNDSTSFPDDSGGPEFAARRDTETRDSRSWTLGLDLERAADAERFGHRVGVTYYERRGTTVSPGVAPGVRDPFGIPPNTENTHFQRTDFDVSTVVHYSESVRLTGGIDIRHEQGTSDSTLFVGGSPVPGHFSADRLIYAPLAEMQYHAASGFAMEAGLRVDKAEGFDAEASPRLGVRHPLTDRTTLRAAWTEGFKLPSFFALGNGIVGNPDLRPERSAGLEVGVARESASGRGNVSVAVFRNRFHDIIDFDPGPPPRMVNRHEAVAEGIELAGERRFGERVQIGAHLSHTKTRLTGSDDRLLNRPEWRGGIDGRAQLGGAGELYVGVLYVGEVRDSSIPTGEVKLDDYARVDMAWNRHLQPPWKLSLAIDNLFDADYREAVGLPAPGRIARLTAQVNF